MDRRTLSAFLVTSIILGGGAVAIWYNYTSSITGAMTATSGAIPEIVSYPNFDQDFTEEINNFDFLPGIEIAEGGAGDYLVTCDLSAVVSTDPACTVDPNTDLVMLVQVNTIENKAGCSDGGATLTGFTEGTNSLHFTALKHTNACPMAGDWEVIVEPAP